MSKNHTDTCYFCKKQMYKGAKFCPHCGKKQPVPFTDQETQQDPYEILQVSKNAEDEVIKAAYKRLVQKYHPDVNKSHIAEEKIRDINWAYEILSDPVRKQKWDSLPNKEAHPKKPVANRPGPTVKEREKTKPKSKLIRCPNCGKETSPYRTTCSYCDYNFVTTEKSPTSRKKTGTNKGNIVAVVLALFIVAWLCVATLQSSNNIINSTSSAQNLTSTAKKRTVTSTPKPTIKPTQTNTPQPDSTIKLPYYESFSDSNTIWWTGSYQYGTSIIENEEYVMTPKTVDFPSYVQAGANVGNVVLEITTKFQYIYPYLDSGFFITFRCRDSNALSCYRMVVNDQGSVFVDKIISSSTEPKLLNHKEWNANVKTFNHPNHWVIVMDGSHFEIYCNDEFILSFEDSTYKNGDIGLGVYISPDNEFPKGVSFDDIKIYKVP